MPFTHHSYQMSCRHHEERVEGGPEAHTTESMRRFLEKERARSNRSGNEFSFVLFDMKGLNESERDISRFIEIVLERIRAIDAAGWQNEHEFGIVLPNTSPEGAKKLAEEILLLHDQPQSNIAYSVYTYPLHVYDE